jgi:hypothetical protein
VAPGTLAHFDPNTNTIVMGEETIRRGTGLATLAHELVHATTPHDGDSKHEEGMANVIGERIAARISGRPGSNPDSVYASTLPLYGELPRFNAGFDENIGSVLGRGRPRYTGIHAAA